MKKQTAVQWLFEQIEGEGDIQRDVLSNVLEIKISVSNFLEIKRIAKEMHKQEIINTWYNGYINQSPMIDEENCGEKFYQETFVSKGSDDRPMERKLLKSGFVDVVPKQDDVREVVEDDVEKLAEKHYPIYEYTTEEWLKRRLAFKNGYRTAKETLYTEEQAIEFAKWLAANWFPMWVKDKFVWEHDWDKTCEEQKYKGYYNEKELFNLFLSLKQPKKD